jgi:hypothetical protein
MRSCVVVLLALTAAARADESFATDENPLACLATAHDGELAVSYELVQHWCRDIEHQGGGTLFLWWSGDRAELVLGERSARTLRLDPAARQIAVATIVAAAAPDPAPKPYQIGREHSGYTTQVEWRCDRQRRHATLTEWLARDGETVDLRAHWLAEAARALLWERPACHPAATSGTIRSPLPRAAESGR